MFCVYLIVCSFLKVQGAGAETGVSETDSNNLPTWLAENPGFLRPEEVDSKGSGEGSIGAAGEGNLGWVVGCNEKRGYGIELELKVSLEPDSEEFVMIAPWPLTVPIKQIKLFTGHLQEPPKQLRIPNTKSFLVVYSAFLESSQMSLKYRRYGTSLEVSPSPPDNPINKRETVFEIQLKGKPPTEYSLPDFSIRFKTVLRSIARTYADAHQIPFNESVPTHQMVLLRRVSFCPFEWPQRDICASLEHSIFVSGLPAPDGFIRDYQLTADHLRVMWSEREFPELAELGITVYLLPRTSRTVLYWSLIVVLMVGFSLMGSFFFWRRRHVESVSSRKCSAEGGARKARRPKLRLGTRQRIPSFMHAEGPEPRDVMEEVYLRERFREVSKPGDQSQLPIKNYFGSILFGSNRAFEDDEDSPCRTAPDATHKMTELPARLPKTI